MPLNLNKQNGFSIIAAIFLIVILSLMGTGMVSLLATSQQSINMEVTSAKTYMAGRTCLQWSMYQMIYSPPAGTSSHTNIFNTDTSSNLYNSSCTVDINIIPDHDENDGRTIIFYNIDVTASFASTASPEYSKRTMHLQYQP